MQKIPDHLEKSLVHSLAALIAFVALTHEKDESYAMMMHRAAKIVSNCMTKAAILIKKEI